VDASDSPFRPDIASSKRNGGTLSSAWKYKTAAHRATAIAAAMEGNREAVMFRYSAADRSRLRFQLAPHHVLWRNLERHWLQPP
jgi:hypothetical protein